MVEPGCATPPALVGVLHQQAFMRFAVSNLIIYLSQKNFLPGKLPPALVGVLHQQAFIRFAVSNLIINLSQKHFLPGKLQKIRLNYLQFPFTHLPNQVEMVTHNNKGEYANSAFIDQKTHTVNDHVFLSVIF